jgi:hypothetical protein
LEGAKAERREAVSVARAPRGLLGARRKEGSGSPAGIPPHRLGVAVWIAHVRGGPSGAPDARALRRGLSQTFRFAASGREQGLERF